MSSLLDLVTQSLGGDATQQISQQLGANPQQTQSAIAAALPMLLSGLTRNAQQPGGAEALHGALASHDGNVLEQLSGLLDGSQNADGAGILRHVLGGRQQAANQSVSAVSGLDAGQVTALLATLAPIVMGALGRVQRQQGLDAGGVAGMLQGEHATHAQASPDLMSMANQLFDRDGDGNAMNDVLKGLGGLLGGR